MPPLNNIYPRKVRPFHLLLPSLLLLLLHSYESPSGNSCLHSMSDRFKGNPLDRQIEILQEFSEEIYSKLNQGLYKKGLDAASE